MQNNLHHDLVQKLLTMSLSEIATLIIDINAEKAERFLQNEIEKNPLKFYDDIEKLKPFLEKVSLKGSWRRADNDLFTQVLLKTGGNINFYDKGTILIQGPKEVRSFVEGRLEIALKLFNEAIK